MANIYPARIVEVDSVPRVVVYINVGVGACSAISPVEELPPRMRARSAL